MKTICFDNIDSTNTYLLRNYQELEDLTFVSSKIQNQGKGRRGRVWDSQLGNLYFSFLLKDKNYLAKYKDISIISALSIVEMLEDYGLSNISIKWPNDIYVNSKKICGILLEAVSKQDLECLVVGVGINVNQEEFLFEYKQLPTSLKLELSKTVNIDEFANKVYARIVDNLNLLLSNHSFYEDIVKYDYLKGKQAFALIDNVKTKINVIKINENYSLKIEYDNKIIDIESGEISFHL